MPSISILHAPRDEAMGAKIAAALESAGIAATRRDAPSGAGRRDENAAIVVWTEAAATLARLHEQAAAAMARGALIPVAVGGAEPPSGFEDLPPVDLSGWTGAPDDPRWRFVLEEIQLTEQRLNLRDGVVWASASEGSDAAEDDIFEEDEFEKGALNHAPPPERAWRSFDDAAPQDAVLAAPQTRAKPRRGFSARQVAFGAACGLVGMTIATALLVPLLLPGASAPVREQLAAPAAEDIPDPSTQNPSALASIAPKEVVVPPADETVSQAAAGEAASETDIDIGAPAAADLASATDEIKAPDTDAIQKLIASLDDEAAAEASVTATASPQGLASEIKPGDTFRDCAECPEMAAAPAGAFRMGAARGESTRQESEGPQRDVTIANDFAIGRREVTYAQWDACVADGGCAFKPSDHGWGRGERPVTSVSYEDALAYAAWLSEKTGEAYRLPSEAEWEYAARAGSQTPFAFGAGVSTKQANFNGEYPYRGAKETFRGRTTPVASFAPNAFGLYDMHGNVWEWTADCWKASHAGAPVDGSAVGAGDCAKRVLKGGAWNTGGWRLRAAHRIAKPKAAREFDNGFRVARDLG